MVKKYIEFRDWLESFGATKAKADRNAAVVLGRSPDQVRKYRLGTRHPKPATVQRILDASNNRVRIESIIANYRGDPYRARREQE